MAFIENPWVFKCLNLSSAFSKNSTSLGGVRVPAGVPGSELNSSYHSIGRHLKGFLHPFGSSFNLFIVRPSFHVPLDFTPPSNFTDFTVIFSPSRSFPSFPEKSHLSESTPSQFDQPVKIAPKKKKLNYFSLKGKGAWCSSPVNASKKHPKMAGFTRGTFPVCQTNSLHLFATLICVRFHLPVSDTTTTSPLYPCTNN